ncbi:hypothetical protein J4410_03715 [Candidatus Woesearchaeota archaeon]|nr:hypothetical protein [Candidatus Woesearchaeota archaeon]
MMPDFSSSTFYPEGKRFCYFYMHYLIVHQSCRKKGPWPHHVNVLAGYKNHLADWYIRVESYDQFDDYLHRFMKKASLLEELEKYTLKIKNETVKRLKKIPDDTRELKKLVTYYYQQIENIILVAGTLRCVDRSLLKKFKSILPHEEAIALASISERPSFTSEEEKALLQLALQLKKQKRQPTKQDVLPIKNTFCWSGMGYYNEKPKTIETYLILVKEMLKKDPQSILEQRKQHLKKDLTQRKKLISTLSKEGKLLAQIAATSSFLKDYYKANTNEITYHGEKLFTKIAEKTHTPSEMIKDLLPEETNNLLDKKEIDWTTVKERIKQSICITDEKKISILIGKEAETFEKKYLSCQDKNKNSFKGRIACKGRAKGKAKIILGTKDFHKLKKGDILVVSNTSPDYIPILTKAVAIIAEEGGLTAHVSLVSRELNIPCIVGIPNIVTLLKDNEEIEVNANKGIVRKL